MADYAADISTSDYLYIREITITERSGVDQTDFSIKLTLTSSNFSFDFARSDGKDFRLGEKSNGTHILNMWIVNWDATNEKAQIWFKIPRLLANETKSLYAYWGNALDTGISDMQSIDFWLADGFDDNTIYNNNWYESGTVNKYFNDDDPEGHSTIYMPNNSSYVQSSKHPLSALLSWSIEVGSYVYEETEDITGNWLYSQRYQFFVPGNDIHYYFARDGSLSGNYGSRTENFRDSAASYPNDYTAHEWGSLVKGYQRHVFGYYLPLDKFYFGLYDRDVSEIPSGCPSGYLGDYIDSIERSVSGNTDFTYLRIYGRYNVGLFTATESYLDWVIIRDDYLGPYEPEFDTSNLYVQYEQVNPDAIDWSPYDSDVTHADFEHTTSSGGTPSRLSDNLYASLNNTWCSVDGAAADANGVDVVIYLGLYGNDVTGIEYLHYDSDHVLYYNASKLSDEDEDINNYNYWHGTTTSGWACIDFGDINLNNVGALVVKGVASDLNGMVKNYKFEGSYLYSNEWEDENWKALIEGQFVQSASWQGVVFENAYGYRFYRLKVIDTYGENISLQEWKMFNYDISTSKKVVSKLRLKPAGFDSQFVYFPKQIKFFGSNDLYNWDVLINTKNTYTPTSGNWQEYSFVNEKRYYFYKLKCVGNWNSNIGKICIPEWEMQEKSSEAYIHRVLGGTTNNFNSIWAESSCSFDSGYFYVSNDVLNVMENDELVTYETIVGDIIDLNLI